VVLNATVTNATGGSYMTVWPSGSPQPVASSMNWGPADTKANAATVKVGAAGKVSVFNAVGTVDIIFNVVGYFTAGSGSRFFPLSPARVLDSRPGEDAPDAYTTPWSAGPGSVRPVTLAGVGGVSANPAAVLANL